MKICFLAAGKSSRIYKKINKPKCLIKINRYSLIKNLIFNLQLNDIKKIYLVVGFQKNKIFRNLRKIKNLKFIENKKFDTHDMLYSINLFLKKNQNDDVIISYSDVLYDQSIVSNLIKLKSKKITLPILTDWEKIWKIRNKKIEDDAETLKINNKGELKEIGRRIKNQKIKYQFMGLIFIPKNNIKKILEIYKTIKSKKMQTTEFLNILVDKKIKIKTLKYKKFWFEFDDIQDLNYYKSYVKKNNA